MFTKIFLTYVILLNLGLSLWASFKHNDYTQSNTYMLLAFIFLNELRREKD